MTNHLPTGSFSTWKVAEFRDSLNSTLKEDRKKGDAQLRLYFYAVTKRGWDEIRTSTLSWMRFDRRRKVFAYVGTDHAITDPEGLKAMADDGVTVRLMSNYRGVFHPKVVWLDHSTRCRVWIGSNNLTRDGLINNIEFAAMIQSDDAPQELRKWADEIHAGSITLTEDNLSSYRNERHKFERAHMRAGMATFTWCLKREPPAAKRSVAKVDLIVEVMPKETGAGGKHIQIPIQAAKEFFKLSGSRKVTLTEKNNRRSKRELTMTLFPNRTVRLVINELEYRDRPCVVLFHRTGSDRYQFEIIPESIFPTRYRSLLALCDRQTHPKSRRWGIVKNAP